MQPATPPKSVPVDMAIQWIKCSVRIAEKRYAFFAATGLFVFLTASAIGFIPHIGVLVGPILGFIYTLAIFQIVHRTVNKELLTFDQFLNITFDQTLIKRFQPYLVGLFVLGLVQVVLSFIKMKYLVLPVSLVASFGAWIAAYSAFYQIRTGNTDLKGSLKFVISGLIKNFLPLLVVALLSALIAAACMALCVVPLFAAYIPLAVPLRYLVYATIFENLDVEATTAHWHSLNNSSAPEATVL